MKWKIKKNSGNKNNEKVDQAGDQSFSLHPIILKLLALRGITSADDVQEFIQPSYESKDFNPFQFVDMEKVVKRIAMAKKNNEKVLISGDYDADGITASLVLQNVLNAIGVENEVYIPHKEDEGYGLNIVALEKYYKRGFSLVITVDCGISNLQEVKKANEIGWDVIITDHHEAPLELPKALAIINPKVKNSGYPFRDLAGVGVAFKFAQAIYIKLLPEKKEQAKWLLDLVAIGTVADSMSLVGENRTLVRYGLLVLSKTKRIGLQEIFKMGRILIDENNIPDAQKISFQIAPRINAASRMGHAKMAFDLLSSGDRVSARLQSLELENQNKSRQKETEQIFSQAKKIVDKFYKNKSLIFIADEHFPLGIVGLVAGKITEKYQKPTAIFKKYTEKSKGSFRSIPCLNILEAIRECRELLEKYGGHAQAAGVTIKNENLNQFYEKLNLIISDRLKDIDLTPEILVDTEVQTTDLTFSLIEGLNKIAPFGKGNAEPIFLLKNMMIQDLKWIGNGEKHLKLFLRPNNDLPQVFEAIGFSMLDKFGKLKTGDKIDILFNLQQDEWNGNKKMQLRIIDLKCLNM